MKVKMKKMQSIRNQVHVHTYQCVPFYSHSTFSLLFAVRLFLLTSV